MIWDILSKNLDKYDWYGEQGEIIGNLYFIYVW